MEVLLAEYYLYKLDHQNSIFLLHHQIHLVLEDYKLLYVVLLHHL